MNVTLEDVIIWSGGIAGVSLLLVLAIAAVWDMLRKDKKEKDQ